MSVPKNGNNTDRVLDALKERAEVLSEFEKHRPEDLREEVLATRQRVLSRLEQDHVKFMRAASDSLAKVQIGGVLATKPSPKKPYRSKSQSRSQDSASIAFDGDDLCAVTKPDKKKPPLRRRSESDERLDRGRFDRRDIDMDDMPNLLAEFDLIKKDAEKYGRYRLALTKEQKQKDDEIRNAIERCKNLGYVATD